MKMCLFMLAALALAAPLFAATTCSAQAYSKACSQCPFDKYGKMKQTCYQSYQDDGVTCLAADYPVLEASYEAGKCPQVDTCQKELEACKEAISSGNDTADCKVPAMQKCYADADKCLDEASKKCDLTADDAQNLAHRACWGPYAIGLFVLTGFAWSRKRQ